MRQVLRLIALVILLGLMASSGYGTQPQMLPSEVKLMPKDYPAVAGSAKMLFTYQPIWGNSWGKVTASVTTENGLQFVGDDVWHFEVDSGAVYTKILNVIVPENDTSGVFVRLDPENSYAFTTRGYFVTTSDSVEYWLADPRGVVRKKRPPTLDTTKYEIILDLQDRRKYEYLKEYEDRLGRLMQTDRTGYYRFLATKDLMRRLRHEGFTFEVVGDTLSGSAKSKDTMPKGDSKPLEGDTLEQQGALDPLRSPTSLPGISLDTTYGQIDATTPSSTADSVVSN